MKKQIIEKSLTYNEHIFFNEGDSEPSSLDIVHALNWLTEFVNEGIYGRYDPITRQTGIEGIRYYTVLNPWKLEEIPTFTVLGRRLDNGPLDIIEKKRAKHLAIKFRLRLKTAFKKSKLKEVMEKLGLNEEEQPITQLNALDFKEDNERNKKTL